MTAKPTISFQLQGITAIHFSLLAIMSFATLVEFFMIPSSTVKGLFIQLFNTLCVVGVLAIFSLPWYLLVAKINYSWARFLAIFFYSLIVVLYICLVAYSTTTLVNLGADILGYSLDDIYITVDASNALSITNFAGLLLAVGVFLGVYLYFSQKKFHKGLNIVMLVIALTGYTAKFWISALAAPENQNKLSFLVEDIIKLKRQQYQIQQSGYTANEYPFLRTIDQPKDVLSPFFNLQTDAPNIVILVVEGLGSEFVGDYDYAGCTPFLDSLIPQSLFWKNFISNTGRSFGVLPSLLGSLPYGEKGFLEQPEIPSHISLFSLLKDNGYTTSFYAGHKASFDKKLNFLEYNGIDYVVDEYNFGPAYEKAKVDAKGFTWGYPDDQILKKTLSVLDDRPLPRLDVIFTLTNHEPFEFPNKEQYIAKVETKAKDPNTSLNNKARLAQYPEVFASLMYVDDAIKSFIQEIQKRPDYNNTIILITGDHRLIPVAQKNPLSRYHVPLYMISPMLKQPKTFASVSSHWDVTPSLLAMLQSKFPMTLPQQVSWMGSGIDTAKAYRNIHDIPLMRYKGNLNDYLFGEYMYSDGELFKVDENFNLQYESNTDIQQKIETALNDFKIKNEYVTRQDKLFPKALNVYVKPSTIFSDTEKKRIADLTDGLNFDEAFRVAQQKAFSQDYDTAQLLCNYILDKVPNHIDARILYGRTLAWQKNYETAENEFLNVLIRAPYYEDTYRALFDLYWWSGQEVTKALPLMEKVRKNNIQSEVVLFKMAKAYKRMGSIEQAKFVVQELLVVAPNNKEYLTFKKSL